MNSDIIENDYTTKKILKSLKNYFILYLIHLFTPLFPVQKVLPQPGLDLKATPENFQVWTATMDLAQSC